jgi:hypothetical protein
MRIEGSKDRRIEGSKDQRIRGSQDDFEIALKKQSKNEQLHSRHRGVVGDGRILNFEF